MSTATQYTVYANGSYTSTTISVNPNFVDPDFPNWDPDDYALENWAEDGLLSLWQAIPIG
jgi:hypothetical protein